MGRLKQVERQQGDPRGCQGGEQGEMQPTLACVRHGICLRLLAIAHTSQRTHPHKHLPPLQHTSPAVPAHTQHPPPASRSPVPTPATHPSR